MGGRWKIDGRRWEGCGPGMPGPYGGWKGERVLAGSGQPERRRDITAFVAAYAENLLAYPLQKPYTTIIIVY